MQIIPGHIAESESVRPTLYRSNSPPKKVGVNRHFQARWPSQPVGCLFCFSYFFRKLLLMVCYGWLPWLLLSFFGCTL